MLGASGAATTASASTSHISEILRLTPSGQLAVAAAHQRVRGDADAAQRGDRVLGRLGLQLAGRREVRAPARRAGRSSCRGPTSWRTWRAASRNGSDSMSPTVPPISVMTTCGASPSGPGAAIARIRALISLVMCGITCTVSPRYSPRRSLAMTRRVDLPGGDVGRAGQVGVEEALVVADVEVGLGAVLGDEDLAVLERVHRARVDVEIRVELLHRDPQAAGLEQGAEAGGRQTLAERGGDAAGDEEVLGDGLVTSVIADRRAIHGSSR